MNVQRWLNDILDEIGGREHPLKESQITELSDALTPPVEALVTALVEIHDYALKNLPRTKPGDIMANDICAKANAALAPFREGS